jgi:hypothetical protein
MFVSEKKGRNRHGKGCCLRALPFQQNGAREIRLSAAIGAVALRGMIRRRSSLIEGCLFPLIGCLFLLLQAAIAC